MKITTLILILILCSSFIPCNSSKKETGVSILIKQGPDDVIRYKIINKSNEDIYYLDYFSNGALGFDVITDCDTLNTGGTGKYINPNFKKVFKTKLKKIRSGATKKGKINIRDTNYHIFQCDEKRKSYIVLISPLFKSDGDRFKIDRFITSDLLEWKADWRS